MNGFGHIDAAISGLYVCDVLNLAEHVRVVEAIWILVVARSIWLLPDWLRKWKLLLGRGD